jgi:hypothetical protein
LQRHSSCPHRSKFPQCRATTLRWSDILLDCRTAWWVLF